MQLFNWTGEPVGNKVSVVKSYSINYSYPNFKCLNNLTGLNGLCGSNVHIGE